MPVSEAIALVAGETSTDAKALVMEEEVVQDEGPPILLSHAAALLPGHRHAPLQRRFGAGVSVVSDLYYFVPPDIDGLLQDLRQGKYCILCGSRQSGKTTSVLAAKHQLSSEPEAATVVYLGSLTSTDESWDRRRLWSYFWDSLRLKCPQLFGPRNAKEFCGELEILSLFAIENLTNPVTVILDEADSLLRLTPTCIDEFFHVIRLMKNEPHSYNLRGFLLVGTERVRDLLEEAHRNKRIEEAEQKGEPYIGGSTPSMLSPFPHDHVLSATKFSLEDVKSLLNQAAADRPGVDIDVEAISDSIMQWTWGHKGLTGTCLAYLVQEELWKFKDWIKRADSYRLGTYIFGQATYNRIIQYVRARVRNDDVYNLLVKLLEVGEILCESESVVELREFIAEGVLVAFEEENGRQAVTLSSPLLRSAILRGCVILGADVDPPPDPARVDRKWVLLQAIASLEGDVMCRPEVLNTRGEPSEYAYQFLFMCRIKAVMSQAYPAVGGRVLPEAKEVRVQSRRRSQLRLDTLVRDGDNFSKFGIELVANGRRNAIAEHLERAVKYHQLHAAQVFVINFHSNKAQEELLYPSHNSVVFVSVYFDTHNNIAEVTFLDIHGTIEVENVPLKRWNGTLSFAHL